MPASLDNPVFGEVHFKSFAYLKKKKKGWSCQLSFDLPELNTLYVCNVCVNTYYLPVGV